MVRFALKGLLGRKLRTALTAIAIVLGVAMVAGTFMLTDSIDKAFDTIFTDVRQGSNAVISGKTAFDISEGTVKAHLTAILRKLNVQNRTQAVLLAQNARFAPATREVSARATVRPAAAHGLADR